MSLSSNLLRVELDEDEFKRVVEEAFTQRFGRGFVKEVRVGKYPEYYGVVVYVKHEEEAHALFELTHRLSDEFYAQGLPVAVSTRVKGRIL